VRAGGLRRRRPCPAGGGACCPCPGRRPAPGRFLFSALGEPLADFVRRHSGAAGLILALICVYRLPDFVLNIMNPFYLDLGFSKLEIAEVRKVLGVVMSVAGVGLGGWAVARLGLIRALVIGAFAGPVSNLAFAWLTLQGPRGLGPGGGDQPRQHRLGLRRHLSDRLHVEPDQPGLHRVAIRPLLSSLYALLGKLGLAVRALRRGCSADGGRRRARRRPSGPLLGPSPPGAFVGGDS
jgi:hypothetical protein